MKSFFNLREKVKGLGPRGVWRRSLVVSWVGIVCILLLVFFSVSFGTDEENVNSSRSNDIAMGTIVSQTIYWEGENDSESEDMGRQYTDDVLYIISSLEEDVLSWRLDSSEVFRINSHTQTGLSDTMYEVLEKIWQVSEQSGGAFDVTIGEITRLWDIDDAASGETENFEIPDKAAIDEALYHTGYEKVIFEDGSILLPEGIELDLGAVGKGIACDEILEYLESVEEISGAVISVGGDVVTYGEKPDGTLFGVAITDPADTSSYIGTLSLDGGWCVSSSGDYERFVEVDGVRYHHIFDPATGYPADSGLCGVTVFCHDGCLSDALSTACFVLGKDGALRLLQQYEDVFAVLIDSDGGITLSPGTEEYFKRA